MDTTTNSVPGAAAVSFTGPLAALHVIADSGVLHVWGEDRTPAPWFPGRRGRRAVNPPARPHPYAANHDVLAATLISAGIRLQTGGSVDVWLPSLSTIPDTSPTAVRNGRPAPVGTSRPAPWTVPVFSFTGDGIATVLAAVATHPAAAPLAAELVSFTNGDAAERVVGERWGTLHRESRRDTLAGWDSMFSTGASRSDWAVEISFHLTTPEAAAAADCTAGGDALPDPSLGDQLETPASSSSGPFWRVRVGLADPYGVRCSTTSDDPAAVAALLDAVDALDVARLSHLWPDGLATAGDAVFGVDEVVQVLARCDQLAAHGVELRADPVTWQLSDSDQVISGVTSTGVFTDDALRALRFDGHLELDDVARRALGRLGRRRGRDDAGGQFVDAAKAKATIAALRTAPLRTVDDSGPDDEAADHPVVVVPDVSGAQRPEFVLDGFARTLMDHQRDAVNHIAALDELGSPAFLFDEMGLGKTAVSYATVCLEPPGSASTLVVVPPSLVENWVAEAAKFCPSRTLHVHHGPNRGLLDLQTADVVVTTPRVIAAELDRFTARRWRRVIVDEAHLLTNPATVSHRAVTALEAGQVVVLTGTPVQNHPRELWALANLACPGLVGSRSEFDAEIAEPIRAAGAAATDALARLQNVFGPYVLMRSLSSTGIDLGELTHREVRVVPSDEQRALTNRLHDAYLDDVAAAPTAIHVGAAKNRFNRLSQQVCNHPQFASGFGPVSLERSPKMAAAVDLVVDWVRAGHRVAVFSVWRRMRAALAEHLSARLGAAAVTGFDGMSSPAERLEVCRAVNAGRADVAVLTTLSGGTGLTMTGADRVLLTDEWWNPAAQAQAVGRVYRIGQDRPVEAVTLLTTGSVEELIRSVIDSKVDAAAAVRSVFMSGLVPGQSCGVSARSDSRPAAAASAR